MAPERRGDDGRGVRGYVEEGLGGEVDVERCFDRE